MTANRKKPTADKIEQWPLDDLKPYERNARTHSADQVEKIARSLQEFGWMNPILLDGTEQNIIAGHGRLMAAKLIRDRGLTINGWPDTGKAAVIVHHHLTPEQKRAYVLADNRLAMDAGWDEELLAAELEDLNLDGFDISVIGFNDDELADLLGDDDEPPAGDGDGDKVPEVQPDPVSRTGDVWLMGNHRVMCGDSTSVDDLDRLMAGENADTIVFDPPYEMQDLYYSAMPPTIPNAKLLVFWDFKRFAVAGHAAISAGWQPQYELIWDNVTSWYTPNRPLARHKAVGVFGEDPKWNFDSAIIYDGKQREAKTVRNTRGECEYVPLNGAVHMRTVEAFPTTAESGGHAHSKPIDWIVALFNGVGGITYMDLFGGSGSTLIACEKTKRVARLMELDPRYVDVIVRRWQDFTGKQAILEGDGRTFSEIEAGAIPANDNNDDSAAA